MSGVIKAASTDQYTAVKLWTSTDGEPKTDVTNSTSGLSIKYQVNNGAIQTVSSPASMSAGGAHADWGIYHRGNGWYKIGLADAVVATAGNRVTVWIELADCDSMPAEIYVSGYDGSLIAVGASTFDYTADEVTTDADSRTASRADVSGLATQADVTDAQTALTTLINAVPDASEIEDAVDAAIDGKLTTERLTKLDNLPSAWPTNLNLLAIDGSGRVLIGASQAADIFAQADLDAIRQAFINAFDGADDQAIIAFEAAVDRRLAAYDVAKSTDTVNANIVAIDGETFWATVLADSCELGVLSGAGTVQLANAPTLTAAAILVNPANKLLTNAAGNVTTSNPATGGTGSAHTAADVAELILANPANKIATNATGQVSASNMRGTDNAALAATALSTAVWTGTKAGFIDAAISSISAGSGLDEAGIRAAIGLESANLDTQLGEIGTALGNTSAAGLGGGATLANQAAILAAIQGAEVIQTPSPNVRGNLVLTQGDTYDGIANPRASWNVTADYTSGWTVNLTIRSESDEIVYTTTGEVVSANVIAVSIAAPTGLAFKGCPGTWQGKFDVELRKGTSTATIALGACFIHEDQTR